MALRTSLWATTTALDFFNGDGFNDLVVGNDRGTLDLCPVGFA